MWAVLMRPTLVLSTKGYNTSGLQAKEADAIVKGFSEGELKEWEAGLQMGVDMGRLGGTSYVPLASHSERSDCFSDIHL